ncbi:MAG: S41 family peptidase [Clostridia bacterium]|nr:S41 family peptidase [Clostridia bacterium]
MKKKTLVILAVVWMMVIVAIGASALTAILLSRNGSAAVHMVSNDEYAVISRYHRLDEVRQRLMEDYYQPLEEADLIKGAIDGMMATVGDPYTFYYTAQQMERSNESASGVYHGVGMLVRLTEDGSMEILRVYEDSPAEQAGLMAGDLLTAVDGTDVTGLDEQSYQQAISMIGGEDGTTVRLTVRRGDEILDFDVRRAVVTVKYVEWYPLDGDLGYIRISQFTGSAGRDFRAALEAMEDADVRGIVVDLRDNPGGNLDVVVDISDAVLPEGIITTIEDRHGTVSEERSSPEHWDIPMAVLINGNSASGSELFSAAVQDYGRGIIIGEQSFGKGIVQTVTTFPEDGAGMQYTTAAYYTPNGRSIHGSGVTPDVVVKPSEGSAISQTVPDPETDDQLAEAVARLRDMLAEADQDAA